jgi:hypothetical protein
VITCICKNQSWVIGTSGTRCDKCGYWLNRDEIDTDVTKTNKRLENVKTDNALIDSYLRKYGMAVDEYGSTEEVLKAFVKFCQDTKPQ